MKPLHCLKCKWPGDDGHKFLPRFKKNILPKFLKKVGEEMLLCRSILVESFSLENGHSWQKKTFVEAEEHQESCLQIQDF